MDITQVRTARPGRAAVLWLALVAALVAGFAANFREMWTRWFPTWHHAEKSLYDRIVGGESYYTHGPLVPLISLLIAVLLVRHTRIRVRPQRAAGLVVLILSVLLHLTASLARVNFVSGFAMIGVLLGLILLMWGFEALRRLWFPIALLLFMVPLPEVSIANLNFTLKMIAARWGVALANMIGINAEQVGNRVLLEGDKVLVIANVCNGLRTLISLLAFGALYTYVCRLRGAWKLLLFPVGSVVVAVASNSLRIVSLIVVADLIDVETATGWYHDTSGILVFVLAFMLMFGLERVILWARRAVGRPAAVLPLFHNVRRGEGDEDQTSRLFGAIARPAGWAAAGVMVVAAGGAWWLNKSIPPMWNEKVAQAALPRVLEVDGRLLHGYDVPIDQQTKDILETGDCLNRQFAAADAPTATLCIIFSKDNRKGTHPPDLCLQGAGEGIVGKGELTVARSEGGEGVPCREITVQTGGRKSYFLYTYKCGGRYTNSFWVQQFTIFANGLLRRDASGALIRVSTDVVTDVADARRRSAALLRAAVPYLDRGLK